MSCHYENLFSPVSFDQRGFHLFWQFVSPLSIRLYVRFGNTLKNIQCLFRSIAPDTTSGQGGDISHVLIVFGTF